MIKVAIADDHALMRQGIKNVLRLNKNIHVTIEAANGKILLEQLTLSDLPDVLLLDIQMPEMDGYETLSILQREYPQIKVIMLSMIQDEFVVNNLLQRGASAFIKKTTEPHEFLEVIKEVYNNSGSSQKQSKESAEKTEESSGIITNKEIEFLKYCPTYLTYEQIADKMLVSPKTLDHYRISLFKKFNVQSRSELAGIAVRMGLGKAGF
jgi:two-component system invasion response regulator UvrY